MIAKTILEQIGGRRFAAMTGSKDFTDMGNGLRMSLARNKTSANRLDIIYDGGADLYNMRFLPQDVQQKDISRAGRRTLKRTRGYIAICLEEMFHDGNGTFTPALRGGRQKPPTFFS